MKIDIWSDVVCPFCYIGKRRLEAALAEFPHRDDVEVVWHSFELDPTAEAAGAGSLPDRLAKKYGMSREQAVASQHSLAANAATVGLDFQWERAQPGNTFDAHRLIHFAGGADLAGEAKERLLRACFTEGRAIGDRATLVELAGEVGLDPAAVRQVLESDDYADAVRADEAQARAYGINGVPFFVLDEKYGISGAQPAEVFTQALAQAWTEAHPLQMVPAGKGDACEGDSCAV